MDTEILHRIQFGFTITFHYIYPPLSIGLSLALIIFEGLWLKTGQQIWLTITKFWARVFALTFALGVATGIPMMFAFGTNWARYSKFIGDVLGSVLASEGLFAFAIEAGCLGVMIFGWDRVSKIKHYLATIGVAFGAHFSALWITCVNSWMQTPAGYAIIKDAHGTERAIVTDWWQVVFNPSAASHLWHVMISAWMTGAFLIISISSYYLLKKRYTDFATQSMKIGLIIAAAASIGQIVSGDHLARLISVLNPTKFAAFEGTYKTQEYTPAYAFGVVDTENKKVYGLGIPGLLSLMVYRNPQTAVPGLEQFPENDWPKVQAVFQVYHLMIGMWLAMVAAALCGIWMFRKNNWQAHPLLCKFLILSVIFPQIGGIAGWYSTCLGRQPWLVHKMMKTEEGYSLGVTSAEVLTSLILFVIVYLSLFALFCTLLDMKIKHGPTDLPEEAPYRDIYK